MSVGLNREAKSAGKSKVSQLNILTTRVDQQILWFQISVEDAVLMQMNQRLQNLVEESLSLFSWQRCVSLSSHILFQIEFQVLEHQIELLLTVNDFFQSKVCVNSENTYSTMLGCLMPLRREISRIAVDGTPSSSFSSLIFFRATKSPVTRSLHL